jgi:glutathionyl-hydroquinone reductase
MVGDDGYDYTDKSGCQFSFHLLIIPTYIRINIVTKNKVFGWGMSSNGWNFKKDKDGNLIS